MLINHHYYKHSQYYYIIIIIINFKWKLMSSGVCLPFIFPFMSALMCPFDRLSGAYSLPIIHYLSSFVSHARSPMHRSGSIVWYYECDANCVIHSYNSMSYVVTAFYIASGCGRDGQRSAEGVASVPLGLGWRVGRLRGFGDGVEGELGRKLCQTQYVSCWTFVNCRHNAFQKRFVISDYFFLQSVI